MQYSVPALSACREVGRGKGGQEATTKYVRNKPEHCSVNENQWPPGREREWPLSSLVHMPTGPTSFPRSLIGSLDGMPHPPLARTRGYWPSGINVGWTSLMPVLWRRESHRSRPFKLGVANGVASTSAGRHKGGASNLVPTWEATDRCPPYLHHRRRLQPNQRRL